MKGIPPFRSMYMESGLSSANREQKGALDGTENPYEISKRLEIKDQWMVGPSLLVAPLFEGQSEREVLLPEGRWYDFYTGDYVGSAAIIKTHPADYRIPLYVKDGGMKQLLGEYVEDFPSEYMDEFISTQIKDVSFDVFVFYNSEEGAKEIIDKMDVILGAYIQELKQTYGTWWKNIVISIRKV